MAQVPLDMVAFDGETNILNRLNQDMQKDRRHSVDGLRGAGLSDSIRARRVSMMKQHIRRNSVHTVANPLSGGSDGVAGESRTAIAAKEIHNHMQTTGQIEPTDIEERLAAIGFLLCGMGIATTWITIQSGLTYYQEVFPAGEGIYQLLLVSYNVPVLPLLVAQAGLDRTFDS